MRTLYVAAGGGGDAVGALLARRALGDTDERPPLVTTCAWERLRIDPVPGPRSRSDFAGLALVDGEPAEVVSTSDTIPAGRSVLPRLAETSGARIFLHDFEGGAVGLGAQLQHLAASLEVDQLVVVDVGGDIVARGREEDLRSPLADSLTLAAAIRAGLPTSVAVLGPGVDAEMSESAVQRLLKETGATNVGRISSRDVLDLDSILSWHPTEATALVAAGAGGMRGRVAMRRGRAPVPITDDTAEVWVIERTTFELFPLARLLQKTLSLSEVEEIMRLASVDEIDFERTVAAEAPSQRRRKDLRGVISDMRAVGATHITSRRLSETLSRRGLDTVEAAEGRQRAGMWSGEDLARIDPSNSEC